MGNWSYLLQADKIPSAGDTWKSVNGKGLIEDKYSYNIIQLIMVSDSPVLCSSIVTKDTVAAIAGLYSDKVLDKVSMFLSSINTIEDRYNDGKHTDFSKLISHLVNKKQLPYVIFDPSDVIVMSATTEEEIKGYMDSLMNVANNIDAAIATILAKCEENKGVLTTSGVPVGDTIDDILGVYYDESAKMVTINDQTFTYKQEKDHIVVYNSDGKEIGSYDSVNDLRHDIKENPEQFTENTIVKENNMEGLFDLSQIILEGTEPAEKPTANVPEEGPKPEGGLQEQPKNKPTEEGPKPPAKTTITQDAYNDAFEKLQKSFKEAYEVMDYLKSASVICESEEDQQREIYESAMDDAFEAMITSGPLFERVKHEDKDKVKEIIASIKDDVFEAVKKQGKMYKPVRLFRRIYDNSNRPGTLGRSAWWGTFAWQVIGMAIVNVDAAKELEKALNEKFKDKLGGYKIFLYRSSQSFLDAFRTVFGIKNVDDAFFVFVDKSVPAELKKAVEEDTAPAAQEAK